ncbi:MAG: hypothetical protein M1815_005958 [Lichina confinis]|nr:MAG: hypothetical protein M1815_005958 [Lichina confinis]
MSEQRELLLKISQISGQINRHKNQQERRDEHPTKRHSWAPVRGAPYGRARGRAGRTVPPVRNRTLVLNNPVPSASSVEASPLSDLNSALSDGATPNLQPVLTQTWVSKNDRHKQLINPAVYEKEREGRMRDLEHTRQLKLAHKDERERSKIQRHLQKFSRPTPDQGSSHEVLVGGVPFRVSHGGSRLVKTSGEASLTNVAPRRPLIALANAAFAGDTPKRTVVGGVTFLRSKHGNLYRSGMVKNKKCVEARLQARLWPFDPQDELKKEEKELTGPACPYIHDHKKVAICKDFLQTGSCSAGDSCDLSHDTTPERVPACVHFLRGKCSNDQCRYAHVRVNPSAPVCRAFATLGFCDKGATCTERHVFECPDYAGTGSCNNKKCRLPHVDRAGQLRKMDASGPAASNNKNNKRGVVSSVVAQEDHGEGESDLSSEEDEADSDDIDSDGLAEEEDDDEKEVEMLGNVTSPTSMDISAQQDYIRF